MTCSSLMIGVDTRLKLGGIVNWLMKNNLFNSSWWRSESSPWICDHLFLSCLDVAGKVSEFHLHLYPSSRLSCSCCSCWEIENFQEKNELFATNIVSPVSIYSLIKIYKQFKLVEAEKDSRRGKNAFDFRRSRARWNDVWRTRFTAPRNHEQKKLELVRVYDEEYGNR